MLGQKLEQMSRSLKMGERGLDTRVWGFNLRKCWGRLLSLTEASSDFALILHLLSPQAGPPATVEYKRFWVTVRVSCVNRGNELCSAPDGSGVCYAGAVALTLRCWKAACEKL